MFGTMNLIHVMRKMENQLKYFEICVLNEQGNIIF